MRTERKRPEVPTDQSVVIPAQAGAPRAQPPAGSSTTTALAGRHLLLVSGRSAQAEGPGVNALAVHLESVGGRVSILPTGSVLADLLGRRVLGRPDLVVAILPGRGSSLAAVRVAERLGTPLLALVTSDGPKSWGENTTLRRATRVAVTNPALRHRVTAAGVAEDRVELWRALLPSALGSFDQIAGRTMRTADAARPAAWPEVVPGDDPGPGSNHETESDRSPGPTG
jgi:hypothetical protein